MGVKKGVCERERERESVLPAQSDQCFGLPLAVWITAPTACWMAIPMTANLEYILNKLRRFLPDCFCF